MMETPDSFYTLVENVCRDLYIQSLKEIPPDVIEADSAGIVDEDVEGPQLSLDLRHRQRHGRARNCRRRPRALARGQSRATSDPRQFPQAKHP
jgi:hypothetical protein